MNTNCAQVEEQGPPHAQSRWLSCALLTVLLIVGATGCRDFWSQFPGPLGGPLVQPTDHSRDTYYGTGVVTRVSGEIVYVDFGEHEMPYYWGVQLLVVRDDRLVGKLQNGGAGGAKPLTGVGCNLIEGTAEKGDMVLGVQHQREYKKTY